MTETEEAYYALTTCAINQCGHKFSDPQDCAEHQKQKHSKEMTGVDWLNRFLLEMNKPHALNIMKRYPHGVGELVMSAAKKAAGVK